MSGEELYIMYLDAMNDEGVGVDEWQDLEESDKAAWNAIASKVQLLPLETA